MSDIRVEDSSSLVPPRAAPLVSTTSDGVVIDLRTARVERTLPTFPALEQLRIDHLDAVRGLASRFESYSDFDATSLWAWSGSVPGGYRIATLGSNLVVEFADYLTGERFLSFIGDDDVDRTAATLLEHASQDRNLAEELRLVPGVSADLLDPDSFVVDEDVDAQDYLYLPSEGARHAGQRYKSLRSSYNSWERRWGARSQLLWLDRTVVHDLRTGLLALADEWRQKGTDGAALAEQELQALSHFLHTPQAWRAGIDGWSGICMTDGAITAMFINERVGDRLSGHFLKTTARDCGNGFHSWYFVRLCRRAEAAGITEMNLQQDLGIPGIRSAKEQLRPHRKLVKCTVRRRSP